MQRNAWARHGYRVDIVPRRGSSGQHRIIRAPCGRVVLQDASPAEERRWIAQNINANQG